MRLGERERMMYDKKGWRVLGVPNAKKREGHLLKTNDKSWVRSRRGRLED